MIVKICGITRLEDADAAVALGATALGFVFWPGSPRFIDPYRARRITSRIPPFITTVGVFVNQTADYVNGVASIARLGAIQLHGDESVAFASELARPVIKAVTTIDDRALAPWGRDVMILVDAHDATRRGGTGRRADWGRAAEAARRRPILLAGGLNPENVQDAIETVRPHGIDVSSGVEQSPGVKDAERMGALFRAIERTQASMIAGRTERG